MEKSTDEFKFDPNKFLDDIGVKSESVFGLDTLFDAVKELRESPLPGALMEKIVKVSEEIDISRPFGEGLLAGSGYPRIISEMDIAKSGKDFSAAIVHPSITVRFVEHYQGHFYLYVEGDSLWRRTSTEETAILMVEKVKFSKVKVVDYIKNLEGLKVGDYISIKNLAGTWKVLSISTL